MPSVIDRAVKELRQHGVTQYQAAERSLQVPAATADGFPVSLEIQNDRSFVVRCDGWVQTFTRAEDAYDCFTFALSDQARLQVIFRGHRAVEWQLQRREYGMWAPGRPVRRRLVPVWRPRHVEYRHNALFHTPTEVDGG